MSLERPFEEITSERLSRWTAEHPEGLVVRLVGPRADTAGALVARPYGEGMFEVWTTTRH